MGASSSKAPVVPVEQPQSTIPTIDPTAFSYVPESIVKASQAQMQAAQQAAEQGRLAAESAAAAAAQKAGFYWSVIKGIMYFIFGAGVILAILFLVDYIGQKYYNKTVIGLLPSKLNDATKPSTAPTDTTTKQNFTNYEGLENPGGYGISWWMFIKDWNYGFGKEKTVLQIAEGKNVNPKVTLHPTENTLKVTISVFGNATSANGEPVPATDHEASDSVYTCEVHDIPLQTWIPISISVFGRNLDVYVDGKLVKSCFLPGVPKPIIGEVALSPDGGFSGFTCDVKKVDNMLTSQDVLAYASAGTTCSKEVTAKGEPASALSSATGYSVKFGVYDTIGKKVKEYTF